MGILRVYPQSTGFQSKIFMFQNSFHIVIITLKDNGFILLASLSVHLFKFLLEKRVANLIDHTDSWVCRVCVACVFRC